MEVLNPVFNQAKFFQSLKKSQARMLLLDYDGTLAPFKIARGEAFPYPGIVELLEGILNMPDSRVTIVSGRPVEGVRNLLKLHRSPEIWGAHGWERLRADGSYEAFAIGRDLIRGLDEARNWLRRAGYEERCESKHGCIALHWRDADTIERRSIKETALNGWLRIAKNSGLEIHEFDGGLELRAPGRNKGIVVKMILSEAGDAVVSYWGDDYTDEDAFRALGPAGLSVLVNEHKRSTSADIWLKPPRRAA